MNVWPGTIADSEREIKRGKSLETRLGIIPLPPSCLTGIQEACDDNVYVTHLATGRLYLFKTRVDPQRPREFGELRIFHDSAQSTWGAGNQRLHPHRRNRP